MFSLFTNKPSMVASKNITGSSTLLSQSMTRLSTGKRINSAADDAAGLQIATRLQSQSVGMKAAKRNISDATGVLQTADGSLEETTNLLLHMKDVVLQYANDTNSEDDRKALAQEYNHSLISIGSIMANSSYGGQNLFFKYEDTGILATKFDYSSSMLAKDDGFNVQIGDSIDQSLNINLSEDIKTLNTSLHTLGNYVYDVAMGGSQTEAQLGDKLDTIGEPKALLGLLDTAVTNMTSLRSKFGASINRLDHSASNLQNMQDNLTIGLGNIQDADYAQEASKMTRNQMLVQTSMSMLKQSNSMSSMIQSLLS